MIDISKQYQTRDGRKVRILCVDAKGMYPIVVLIEESNAEWARSFTEREFNEIFVPVPEKRRLKGWLNVYPQDSTVKAMLHEVREDADRFKSFDRAACVQIDIEYTVGEGL